MGQESNTVRVESAASKGPLAGPRRGGYDSGMSTTTPGTFLGEQFARYASGWPPADPAGAMPCRELEERLAYGMGLYRLAQSEAEAVGRRMEASGVVYDRAGASYVESLLTLWVGPAPAALAAIEAAADKGCEVDGATAFREAVLDVRVSLSIPVERAADQAEEYARNGVPRGRTTEALRRELRDRWVPKADRFLTALDPRFASEILDGADRLAAAPTRLSRSRGYPHYGREQRYTFPVDDRQVTPFFRYSQDEQTIHIADVSVLPPP